MPATWLLVGCGSGEDLVTSVALPADQATGALQGDSASLSDGNDPASNLDVTPAQRAYLDELTTEGVHPPSELRALSIGAYVCQAHAAGQSDQAVWNFIAPMVRSDVTDAQASPQAGSDVQVDTATADYIRIATQRLC